MAVRNLVNERSSVAAGIGTMLRQATLASGQDLPTAVGEAFRQLATPGTASLQALAPVSSAPTSMRGRCGRRPGPVAGHCRH